MSATLTARPLFIGVSLKMYFDHRETLDWCHQVMALVAQHPAILSGAVELVVLPTAPALPAAHDIFAGSPVRLGAQDLFWEDRGAFTGEIGGPYLREIGCVYAEIGHTERRRIFNEDATVFRAKIDAAVRNQLTPILCIGEHDRVSPAHAAQVCIGQLRGMLAPLLGERPPIRVVVAYEPEWAIGAEHPAESAYISEVSIAVRDWLHSEDALAGSQLIYGGSAGPGLLTDLGDAVDGLFLGRFAHDPAALFRVVQEGVLLNAG